MPLLWIIKRPNIVINRTTLKGKVVRPAIFLHIPKSGGTSIRRVLSMYEGVLHDMKSVTQSRYRYPRDFMHYGFAVIVRDCVGDNVWYKSFKFAFVRNPWDRLVSVYAYFKIDVDFPYFVEKVISQLKPIIEAKEKGIQMPLYNTGPFNESVIWHSFPQYYSLFDSKGRCLMDFVGRFEKIQSDFSIVCKHLGIREKSLSVTNCSNHEHYTGFYDKRTIRLVSEAYVRDIETFSYRFGD